MLAAKPALLGLALSLGTHVDEGLKALDALDYDRATSELQLASHEKGLSHAEMVRLLEAQGRLQATLGHHDAAVAAFEELLEVDPAHAASSTWAPKIRTPFFEAKSWQADHPQLALKPVAPVDSSSSAALTLNLLADPLSLVKTVRVHLVGVDAPIDVAVSAPGTLSVPLPAGAPSSYWAEALDGNGGSLVLLGDPTHPLDRVPTPAATASANAVEDEGSPALRYAGIAVGAAGLVAIGVGVVMGAQEQSDQSKFNGAARNAQGQITSLTRAAAMSLDSQARTDGMIADVLFAAGGVAAATGVGLWMGGVFMSATPAPGGAAVAMAGTFP